MIIEDIFRNIFNDAFGNIAEDTGLSLGGASSDAPKKDKKTDLREAFSRGVAHKRDKEKELASYNRKKINRGLRKDKDLTINRVISKRFVPTDDEGRYPDADLKNFMDEYKGDTEIEIPSTAIADVKYDPRSRVCYVRYTSGNKWYRFVNMSPEQFRSFMNASSKGRYVQRIMRKRNHDPAYPRTI